MKKKELIQFLECFTDDVDIVISFDQGKTLANISEPEYSWKTGEQAKIILHADLAEESLAARLIEFMRQENLINFVDLPGQGHNNDIDYLKSMRPKLIALIDECEKL